MTPTRRTLILGMLATVCAPSVVRAGVEIGGGLAFGSSWRITVGQDVPISRVRPTIEAVIAEVDRQMSPYRPTSDLSRFNAARTSGWQDMPGALCHVTAQALRIASLTEGAFDPTVGPLVSRLGFGPIRGGAGHPSDVEVTATALRKDAPDLTLDLCGIAKGYALDRIVDALARAGVSAALLEIGGEVRAIGNHPDGRPWNVAIADPRADRFAAHRIVVPGRLALATSGHSVNGLSGPVSTSHIIDPLRRRSASPDLLSVTVLAPTGTEADAMATALCARGLDAGVNLARHLGISALFLGDGDPGMLEVMTGRFADHLLI